MAGDLQRELGRNLRTWRHKRGLSQEAFAEHLGISRTYLSGVERGKRNVRLSMVERLAERTGMSAVELLAKWADGDGRPTQPSRRI